MIAVAKSDDIIEKTVSVQDMSLSVRRTAVSTAADAGYPCTRVRNMTLLMRGHMMTRRASSSLRDAEGRWSGMTRLC